MKFPLLRIQRGTTLLIGLGLTLFFALLYLVKPSVLQPFENRLLDLRFKLRGPLNSPDNVVIAAIDEKSIEKLGRWPWSRDVIAELVDKLYQSGAEIIVFDIILSEREKHDAELAQSLRRAGNVILPIVFELEGISISEVSLIKNFALKTITNQQRFLTYPPINLPKILVPRPEFLENAMSIGHINVFPDEDGVLRWEPLLIAHSHDGSIFPSITLRTSAIYLGVPEEKVVVQATEGVWLGKRFIPTDRWGRLFINYYGPTRTFKHYSIVDILERKTSPDEFYGKIVLIGATAVGIYDLRVTPYSPVMPGVEKHASVIASIIENRVFKVASSRLNFLVIILSGIVLTFAVWRIKGLLSGFFATFSLLTVFFIGHYFFLKHNLLLNLAFPLFNLSFIFILTTLYNYVAEEKQARWIRSIFSSYVTERVVNELIKNPDMLKLGGQRREVTVLFSDIRGFTSFSEKHSPEEVVSLLNEYLSTMTEVVFKWDGTLDKFIGDAIMVFWGAPLEQKNHAELAVRCALDMVRTLRGLQAKWQSEGKPILDCGIGINSGDVLVGNIGAQGKKMDYTIIGDHVNLGSRVEGLTRKYNAHILITEYTYERLKPAIEEGKFKDVEFREVEKVQVKGKEIPVTIYEVREKNE